MESPRDTHPSPKPDHLCVLVHGLWGNPSHLDYVQSALKERHGDNIYVLVAKRNAGHFTYDGIELGGERLAHEVEETLDTLRDEGYQFRKLSVAGYSLGGLVARYAIGLLDARGWLDTLEPINFTTFATPHVGVRAPVKGVTGKIWNALAPRTISVSGRQLFLIDSFRDTGKPLLSVMADPDSIFIQALGKFRHRSAYANIVNDRSAVFYTTFISAMDPFRDLDATKINYVKGYEPVVIDPDVQIEASEQKLAEPSHLGSRAWKRIMMVSQNLPLVLLVTFILPIFITIYLGHSTIQTCRSRQRIRLHEEGKNGVLFKGYKIPLMIQDMQHAMQDALEVNSTGNQQGLLGDDPETSRDNPNKSDDNQATIAPAPSPFPAPAPASSDLSAPTTNLALTPAQLAIINTLNNIVGFRKYPVYIHNHRHSHAAIIVRMRKPGFDEGKVVIRHWLDRGFVV